MLYLIWEVWCWQTWHCVRVMVYDRRLNRTLINFKLWSRIVRDGLNNIISEALRFLRSHKKERLLKYSRYATLQMLKTETACYAYMHMIIIYIYSKICLSGNTVAVYIFIIINKLVCTLLLLWKWVNKALMKIIALNLLRILESTI